MSPVFSTLEIDVFHVITFFWMCVLSTLVILSIRLITIYFIDKNQKSSTLRRNYPVIARFRYIFEHLGIFLRQYFLQMIVKSCLLIDLNGLGYIDPQRM